MKVKDLILQLQKRIEEVPSDAESKIVITIIGESKTGISPHVEVDSILYGFDWNRGHVFLMSDRCNLKIS
jgi:hypothetical protein